MGAEVIVTLIIFSTLFGIVYLIVASRTRIRMALIEKGADASIFSAKSNGGGNIVPIILVNLGLLLFSIGIAVFLGSILHQTFGVIEGVAYTGTTFTLAGLGMLAGYWITSKILKNRSSNVLHGS